jgi:exonuclease VII small subunit
MLSQQENILVQVIDNYKEGLKKKREMMQALRKTVAEIEYLMKENQVLRKEMIQHWDDVIPLHSVMKSN